jgi:hypothetical protein
MKRYFDDKERIYNEYKKYIYKYYKGNFEAFQIRGYFRKRKAGSCKVSKCLVCHYEKVLNIKSAKDKISDDIFNDSLREYYEQISDATDY